VVNTSPEPVSNIGLSLIEDVGVAGLVTLAVTYPVPTIIVVAILVVAATTLTIWIWRIARRSWKKLGRWLEDRAWYPSTG
jgi:uncharacterized membrane protein (Fun14 family)